MTCVAPPKTRGVLVDDGVVVARQVGAAPEHVLSTWLDEALTNTQSSKSSPTG